MVKVLLLENVEYCLRFYRATLIANGFTVITSATVDEAARCCADHPDISLIVAEASMRDENSGRMVAERMALQPPPARILYVSAYSLEHLVEAGAALLAEYREDMAFLPKPFSAMTFLQAVRKLLPVHAATA